MMARTESSQTTKLVFVFVAFLLSLSGCDDGAGHDAGPGDGDTLPDGDVTADADPEPPGDGDVRSDSDTPDDGDVAEDGDTEGDSDIGGDGDAEDSGPTNRDPVFLSEPTTSIEEGGTWLYAVRVEDPDGDHLTLSLVEGPEALIANLESGSLFWSVGQNDEGVYRVVLEARDGRGGEAAQSFEIRVTRVNRPPRITSEALTEGAVGSLYRYAANAVDPDDDPLTWHLLEGSEGMVVSDDGVVTFTPAAGGIYRVTLEVSDPDGEADSQPFSVGVPTGSDGRAPSVSLDSPPEASVIREPTEVIGTVTDDNLVGYRLEICQPPDAEECPALAVGFEEVRAGALGILDPSPLVDGTALIRLSAWDTDRNEATVERAFRVHSAYHLGTVSLQVVDLVTFLGSTQFELVRTYDSRSRSRQGDFGFGWTLDILRAEVEVSHELSTGWEARGGGFGRTLVPTTSHLIEVQLPDGRYYGFVFTPSLLNPFDSWVRPGYRALEAGSSIEAIEEDGSPYAAHGELYLDFDQIIDSRAFEVYEPPAFRVRTPYDEVLEISRDRGLFSMTDVDGQRFIIGDDGVDSEEGAMLAFTRDSAGRITRVEDRVHGQILSYSYDARGDLAEVTHPEGERSTFAYDETHLLIGYELPDGLGATRFEYDDRGRVVRKVFPDGRVIVTTYDDEAHTVTVTDATGASVVNEYDEAGNVVALTDPNGNHSTMTYDDQGRLLTETNALGAVMTFSYDEEGNTTSRTDPLGNRVDMTYDDEGSLTSITDPDGRLYSVSYSPDGQPAALTAPSGTVVHRWTWDGRGRMLTEGNGLGHATTYTYDDSGRPSRVEEPSGLVTTFSYDDHGLIQRMVDNDGSEAMVRIHPSGRVLEVDMGEERRISYDYIFGGDLSGVVTPEGERLGLRRNPAGNITSMERDGEVEAERSYDAAGRPTLTRWSDGDYVRYRYDPAGNVVEAESLEGVRRYRYDEANRVIEVQDAAGRTVGFERDLAGRVVAVEDGLSRRFTIEYDGAGHVTRVTDPAGRVTDTPRGLTGLPDSYAAPGRGMESYSYDTRFYDLEDEVLPLVERVDPSGGIWSYENGDLGLPTRVTDPAGNDTLYEYDPDGNVEQITDAAGEIWAFQHEDGQLFQVRTPAGQVTDYLYDPFSGAVTTARPDGSEVVQEAADGEVRTSYPGGLELVIARDDQSRTIRTESPADDVSYRWSDELTSVVHEDGARARFDYDPEGRVVTIEVTTPDGARGTTSYEWDEGGRMAAMIDPSGGRTEYSWDVVDRLTRVERPNGAISTYGYGTSDRPTEIVHRDGAGAVIARYSFELDAAGRRSREETPEGTFAYRYDELGRLIEVSRSGGGGPPETRTYEYDAVGNRVRMTDGSGVTTYTHDPDGRVLSAHGPDGETTYAYDGRGNLLTESGPDGRTSNTWDEADRLVRRALPDGTVREWTYDAEGHLVSIRGPEGERRCLAAPRQVSPLSDCLAFYGGGGETRIVLFDPLGVAGDSGESGLRFAHRGALRSVVALTSSDGSSLGRYGYDAFGQEIHDSGPADFVHRFTGAIDQGGLTFLRSRWYAPHLGLFLSSDSAPSFASDPRGLHRYLYALGDPLNGTDPLGTTNLSELNVVTAIQGILNAIRGPLVKCMVRFTVKLVIGMLASLVIGPVADGVLATLTGYTGPFLEDSIDEFLRNNFFCSFTQFITYGGPVLFQVNINDCGRPHGSHRTCSSPPMPGDSGVDFLLFANDAREHGLPVELKRNRRAWKRKQMIRYCRYASRNMKLIFYVYYKISSAAATRAAYVRDVKTCLGCWGANPPVCASRTGGVGAVMIWVGLDSRTMRPKIFLPNPRMIC